MGHDAYPITFTISIVKHFHTSIFYPTLHVYATLHNTKFDAFREIIITRATSGGRREIELNSGSLPPIPGGLATLVAALRELK